MEDSFNSFWLCYTLWPMDWEHKGITFSIQAQKMGPLVMASARTSKEGMFIRVRPFSAIGKSEEEALSLLKEQIRYEYRKVPEMKS